MLHEGLTTGQAAQVYGSGGFRCGRRTGHASRGPPGPLGALWVRAAATSVPQARVRVAGAQHRAGFPRARNGAGFDGHHALFFVPLGWLRELPPGLERGVKSDPCASDCIGPYGKAKRILSASLWHGALGMELGLSGVRSEEHTSELQSRRDLVCRLLLE